MDSVCCRRLQAALSKLTFKQRTQQWDGSPEKAELGEGEGRVLFCSPVTGGLRPKEQLSTEDIWVYLGQGQQQQP